ncbi:MAG TPA: hypothetical protein PK683_16810, partial [Leptospiraceae bacterium]|nr:hypothetical protein [Leptospiraceae bacterium]
ISDAPKMSLSRDFLGLSEMQENFPALQKIHFLRTCKNNKVLSQAAAQKTLQCLSQIILLKGSFMISFSFR